MVDTRTRKWKYETSYTQGTVVSFNAHYAENESQAIDKVIEESLKTMKKCMPAVIKITQKRDFIFN